MKSIPFSQFSMRHFPILFSCFFIVRITHCQNIVENQITESNEEDSSTTSIPATPTNFESYAKDIEIIRMYMTSSNSLKLFWGVTPDDIKSNKSYGLFYDLNSKDNLKIPKTTTRDPCIEVLNLKFCEKYFFAVASQADGDGDNVDGWGRDGIDPNSGNIRSIVTYMDPAAPPTNVRVEFLPGPVPCLLIKWTASCRNMLNPVGYKIMVNTTTYSNVNILRPGIEDRFYKHFCTLPVRYGDQLEISISNDVPEGVFSKPLRFEVPHYMQPYDLRLALNQSNRAFLVYWREPFVPPKCEGRFLYEVYVFDDETMNNFTVFETKRPGIVYRGSEDEYTFGVDLICCDFNEKSAITELVRGNLITGEVKNLGRYNFQNHTRIYLENK